MRTSNLARHSPGEFRLDETVSAASYGLLGCVDGMTGAARGSSERAPAATSAQLPAYSTMSREGPVIRAPVQPQPGSMPAFLIARTASGEVRNFRSAAAPAGFLAWLCTPPEKTVISCMSSGRGPR